SSASSGEAHMWNYVKMDNDTWYLVDATWDDQLSGIRTIYLLAGWNSKGFNHNTLREERTEKDTFSSPTKYTPQAFIYPLISDNSYLIDIIGKIFLSQAAASMESDAYAYTGNAIRPEVKVVCNGKVLVKDTDYRVIYKDNQDIGTAEVTIHGIGEYIGNITIRFQIYCGHNNMLHTEGKKATCTEAGKAEYWYCSVCEKYFSDEAGTKETTLADTVISATGHQLNKTDSKAATCTEAGNTEYWTCNACGKYFSDEAGTNETRLADTVIPATGHHYGEYQLTKEATALEEGVRTAYCSCGAYMTVAVPALTPSIKLNVSSLRLRVKQKYTVKVTGLAKGDSVVSWSTGNKKIARVSQKGVVTGKARGNTIITIRLASGYTQKIRVYVQQGIVKTTALKISNTRLTLKKGRSYTLRTTVAPVTSQEKVTFKSSNSKVVSVNAKGKIYAKKKGKARITVRSGKKRRVCVVTVK
ncbi:Ig-like domain-containing protein, partial [Blautia ammoniilytica]